MSPLNPIQTDFSVFAVVIALVISVFIELCLFGPNFSDKF